MSAPDPTRIPRPALILGVGGLLPFIVGAVGGWVAAPGDASLALNAMLGYGAVILSFLGGAHWGRALAPDLAARPGGARLLWSVTPALIGWGAMFAGQIYAVLTLYIAAFLLAFIVDRKAVAVGMFPPWYGRLRRYLTIGVLACLMVGLMAVLDGGRGI
ncbi:DUF3429 domain-containing protein [Marivibrio halodurans]|uniref:DUF3429 domain-containing protein n=1 Tax=Marivibrio halodurans TaxID=2039722 RepID=A0A8J7V1P9_9PROT|nr:DUF3429 domain-containing protein [Marivibrio halodurans]MBP5856331.1 DUF3429 domain-containing protein [Marivibrio halodurans]